MILHDLARDEESAKELLDFFTALTEMVKPPLISSGSEDERRKVVWDRMIIARAALGGVLMGGDVRSHTVALSRVAAREHIDDVMTGLEAALSEEHGEGST